MKIHIHFDGQYTETEIHIYTSSYTEQLERMVKNYKNKHMKRCSAM